MANDHLSLKLYGYLCAVSGSENAVRKRRLFLKTLDTAINTNLGSLYAISSGSKAEGLVFNGSDFDIMFIMTKNPVYNESEKDSDWKNIILDTTYSSPGFAVLKVQNYFSSMLLGSLVHTNYGILLSSDKFKEIFEPLAHDEIKSFVRHGPCLSSPDMSLDLAFCLHCQSWPLFAFKWLERSRSKWPSVYEIEEIKEQGVLLVPIGDSDKPDLGAHEWRISFSMAEKTLIHSFNHTQLLCYALLKFVLKEIINMNKDTENLLCSYFIKTVLFWEIEINECLIWEPNNLIECYMQCFRRLAYFVRCGYCPNYFMPENNLFRNKIFDRAKEKMEDLLTGLISEGIDSLQRSQTLRGFFVLELSRYIGKSEETFQTILPLLNLFEPFVTIARNCEKMLSLCLTKIKTAIEYKSQLVSELLLLYFAECFGKISEEMNYDFRIRNKAFYTKKKASLPCLLIGRNSDSVSGWLQIAAFFYQHKQYDIAIFITDYAIAESQQDRILISPLQQINGNKIIARTFNLSFFRSHKLFCMYNREREVLPHSFLAEGSIFVMEKAFTTETFVNHMVSFKPPMFLNGITTFGKLSGLSAKKYIRHIVGNTKKTTFIQTTPAVFGRYLRLLCFHQLQKPRHVRQELHELQTAITENRSSDIESNMSQYCWLFNAMDLAGYHEQIIPSFYQDVDGLLNDPYWKNVLLTQIAKCFIQRTR